MHIVTMSDLHLSGKHWEVRRAFRLAKDTDLVLLAGDLVNDGKESQFALMQKLICEELPDTPVLAVAGNHDYPREPSAMIRCGVCDYPALEDWLLTRQPYPVTRDESGAWAVRAGETDFIGLNCVWHWRRFKFIDGAQLRWLEQYLERSDALRHVILCHAPLLAHNPKRSDTKPYLSRDAQLQEIVERHRNVIFISGHTHVSLESAVPCVEYEAARNHLYISDGSIRRTTVLTAEAKPLRQSADGNIVALRLSREGVTVTGRSVIDGRVLCQYEY